MKTREQSEQFYLKIAELSEDHHRWQAMRELAKADLY